MFGDIERQKLWYDFTQNKVMELLEPLRISLAELYVKVEQRIQNGDQLRFFDYIYPSISQRLAKLENEKNTDSRKFKLKDYVVAYYGHYTRAGQITEINDKGLINIDDGKLYFHPNQLRYQGEK